MHRATSKDNDRPAPPLVTRRQALAGLAGGVGLAVLSSCSGTGSPGSPAAAGSSAPGTASPPGSVAIPSTAGVAKAPVLLGVPVTQTPNPPGSRPDPTRPEGTDLLPQIEHIVVLMMENHSFDNYFGMLGRGEGFTLGPDGKPTNANPGDDGKPVTVHHQASTSQAGFHVSQNWVSSHTQFDDGKLDGFVKAAGKDSMGYWDGSDLPYYYSLARQFPICDRYFCSVLAQTYPNRRYAQAATSRGNVSTDVPSPDEPLPPAGTIFDKLDQFGVSWTNYTPALPETALWLQGVQRHPGKTKKTTQFVADAQAGTLPAYSLVSPHPNVSEENPQDISHGEAFSAAIINAVLASPLWPKTLLVFTYDEHGGYYDHVPPPKAFAPDDVPPDPAKTKGVPGGFDQLGFRVPTVIISPHARKDYVSHVVHDHTSILRLLETKWNLGALTYRDANASNLLDSIDLDNPPAFATPPRLDAPKLSPDPVPVVPTTTVADQS